MRKYGLCAQNTPLYIIQSISSYICAMLVLLIVLNFPLFAPPVTQVSLASCIHTKRYEISKFKKVVTFYVHISPIFLMPGHVCIYTYIIFLHNGLYDAIEWMHSFEEQNYESINACTKSV